MATEVIWHVFGGDLSRPAPIVDWYEGDKLDCPGGTSFWAVTEVSDYKQTKQCLLGVYIRSMHVALVAWRAGQAMSATALAHELCHAYFKEETPHEICKNDDGPVKAANEQLRLMGL